MRNLFLIASLFVTLSIFAQKNVAPMAISDASDGVVYSLPKTALEIQVTIKKTIHKAGPYAKYATEYFGMENSQVVMEDTQTYEIADIKIKRKGLPHPARTFKVTAKEGSGANQIKTDENGVIYGVNLTDEQLYELMLAKEDTLVSDPAVAVKELYFDKSDLVEGYFFAPARKMQDVAASQIYLMRESQLNLLMGNAENMPTDAESLQFILSELKKRENALLELFTGKSTTVTEYKTFELIPERAMKDRIIFYFSPAAGLTSTVEGITNSYYISLKINKAAASNIITKNSAKSGFYYCVPGTVDIEIYNDEETLFSETIPVAQFGTLMSLPVKYVENNNATIIFDTTTGAIKTK